MLPQPWRAPVSRRAARRRRAPWAWRWARGWLLLLTTWRHRRQRLADGRDAPAARAVVLVVIRIAQLAEPGRQSRRGGEGLAQAVEVALGEAPGELGGAIVRVAVVGTSGRGEGLAGEESCECKGISRHDVSPLFPK